MTRDPPRLRRGGSPAERDLLESARDDAPSAEAERRARIALGLAVPLIPLPGPGSAGSAAPATAASVKAAGTLAGAIKVASLTIAVAGLSTAGWLATRTEAPPPPPIRAPSVEPPPVAAPKPEPEPEPAVVVEPAPEVRPARRARPPKPPGLPLELELIRAARSSLEAGRAEDAEAALQRYRREVGAGSLREEAEALGVETGFALALPEARARAEAFLVEFADRPYAARARALLGERGP